MNSQCEECVDRTQKSKKYVNTGQKNCEFYVSPGTYFIIPFIENAIGKSNYILQILSEESHTLE